MKFTSSVTEDEYRSDLLGSKKFLFENPSGSMVLKALTEIYGELKSAYVLAHTPEQGEDIFHVLVNGESVVGFELPIDGSAPENVTVTPVKTYERMLGGSREGHLRLSLAQHLAKEEMVAK